MTPYGRIKAAYDGLPDWDREGIINNSTLRESFLNRFTQGSFTLTHADLYLEHIIALENKDVSRLEQIREALSNVHSFENHILDAAEADHALEQQVRALIIQHKVAEGMDFDDALTYHPTRAERDHAVSHVRSINGVVPNKHDILLVEIEEALDNAILLHGSPDLSKTEILKTLRKDKGIWREPASDVLSYLAAKGRIVKVGTRYHHINHSPRMVETDFTRKVFESLYHGPLTINGIVKSIGYDNSYGRKKVRKTLDFLVAEGLVINQGYRWIQTPSSLS